MSTSPKVLFLCTGNSCRSQMAEAFARKYFPQAEVFSAGVERHGLNPHMLDVMRERGFSMHEHFSKTFADLPEVSWDLLVTVCGNAEKSCPVFPAKRKIHAPFDDPPALAKGAPDGTDVLSVYRRVRDEIEFFIKNLDLRIKLFTNGKVN